MRRRLPRIALAAGALLFLAWGVSSVDRCGPWEPQAPGLMSVTRARGALKAGAAVVPLTFPFAVTAAGYGPWRPSAKSADVPVTARASVVEVGQQRFALVLFDTLLVPAPLVEAVRQARPYPVWVAATHTHSGPGNFDRRLAVETAALGSFDPRVETLLTTAATRALAEAEAQLAPATLEVSQGKAPLSKPRTGLNADDRLLTVRFLGEGDTVLAQWLLLAAHPTLVPRRPDALHPDYPGLLARDAAAPLFVLQTAVGNAKAAEREPAAMAAAVTKALEPLARLRFEGDVDFAFAQVRFGLGHPDGSRLAPSWLKPAAENVLCDDADREAELSVVRLGPVALLAAPVEPTRAAAEVLEQQSGVTRIVGVTNGYLGYVEPEGTVQHGEGESKKQYFGADFLSRLAEAARLAGSGAGTLTAQR